MTEPSSIQFKQKKKLVMPLQSPGAMDFRHSRIQGLECRPSVRHCWYPPDNTFNLRQGPHGDRGIHWFPNLSLPHHFNTRGRHPSVFSSPSQGEGCLVLPVPDPGKAPKV